MIYRMTDSDFIRIRDSITKVVHQYQYKYDAKSWLIFLMRMKSYFASLADEYCLEHFGRDIEDANFD